jgi:hypothetical protein
MRVLKTFAPVALLLSSVACLDTIGPSRERLGLLTTNVYDNAGTPVIRGTGTFYRLSGLSLQALDLQPCALFGYDPDAVAPPVETLDAGNFISFAAPGNSVSADRIQLSSFIRYEMAAGQYLLFAAGDTITVSIPGAIDGIEPTQIKVRAAEPFTADTIPDFELGQPLSLTWDAATATGSYMIVSLRYNDEGSSVEPNVEISCVFADNGNGLIPTNLAQAWANAPGASRSYKFTRARETYFAFDSRTRTRLRSHYEVPTPLLPPSAITTP